MVKMEVMFKNGIAVSDLVRLHNLIKKYGGEGVFVPLKSEEAQNTSTNIARDAIATIIWDAVKEFDAKSTVNVNDYADQVLRYVATAPVA